MSASTLSRRTLLAGASALAGMASLPAFAQGGSIKVATWGGSWRDSLDKTIGEKIRAAGGTVDYVVDTPQGNLAKLVASRGQSAPFDNMESGLELVQLMAADRFVAGPQLRQDPERQGAARLSRARRTT